VKVPAHLAAVFGTNDPNALFFAAVRRMLAPMREVEQRVAKRLGKDFLDFPDDENPNLKHRIRINPPKSAGPDQVGLILGIIATRVKGGGELLADEARRAALNLPIGPRPRGLEGDADPLLSGYSLDDSELIDPTAFGLLRGGAGSAGGFATMAGTHGARSFDPVVTPGVLIAVLSFLAVVAPMVLPTLIETGKRFIEQVQSGKDPLTAAKNVITGEDLAEDEAKAAAAKKAADDEQMKQRLIMAGAALALVGLVVYFKRRAG
jgi:hypothetical protein